MMRDLTFICAFFENQGMLREQQRVWRSYPRDLKAHFHAIVTDDCSPASPAVAVFEPVDIASYRLFRALVKKRWNWLFARNLGVAQATTEWVVLTDIDHVLPAETLRVCLTSDLHPESVYRFTRVDAPDLTPYKQHPNTWMLTRAMFDAIGGYDERFSGFYGSDSEFRERVQTTARDVKTLPVPLIRYPREVIPDASTVASEEAVAQGLGFQRKAPEDGVHVPRIKAERAKLAQWRPLRVQLPYRLEASC